MSFEETAYLTMVLVAFSTFIAVVGFLSVWSRRPADRDASAPTRRHMATFEAPLPSATSGQQSGHASAPIAHAA